MKTLLCKKIAFITVFVFLLIQSFSTRSQTPNQLLLPGSLNDSLSIKTATDSMHALVINIPLQEAVRSHAKRYLDINALALEGIKEKQKARFDAIEKILVRHSVPPGLVYLAIVESELNNKATSPVGAAGIWQLMPATARSLGLKVNGKADERRHTTQSSVAAAEYLKTLYKQYDDWLLVVAAYNCGAGNVNKAIRKSGSRDFWKLQQFLPAETKNHVKHFIATHFYYEKNGSVVTLTKKERLLYLSTLDPLIAKKDGPAVTDTTVAVFQPGNVVLVGQPQSTLLVELKK